MHAIHVAHWAHVVYWWVVFNAAVLLWLGYRKQDKGLPPPHKSCRRNSVESIP